MIRDRIVLGIASQRVRERLLQEENLNLAKVYRFAMQQKLLRENLKKYKGEQLNSFQGLEILATKKD